MTAFDTKIVFAYGWDDATTDSVDVGHACPQMLDLCVGDLKNVRGIERNGVPVTEVQDGEQTFYVNMHVENFTFLVKSSKDSVVDITNLTFAPHHAWPAVAPSEVSSKGKQQLFNEISNDPRVRIPRKVKSGYEKRLGMNQG